MKYEKAFAFEANEETVELRFSDGTILRLDRRRIEAGIVRNASDQISLDWLAYDNPFAYVQLMLYRDPRSWLQRKYMG